MATTTWIKQLLLVLTTKPALLCLSVTMRKSQPFYFFNPSVSLQIQDSPRRNTLYEKRV